MLIDKNKLGQFIMAVILLFFINTMNINASDEDKNGAVDYINNIRNVYNMNLLEVNDHLQQSSESHSKYMSINNIFSSIEESENRYYTGRYTWDRASYHRYSKPYVYEFISNDISSYKEGVINLINNPYSRIMLFNPMYEDIGIGKSDNMYTFQLGGSNKLDLNKLIVYPYNEMTNVPINWTNYYQIDPYRLFNKDKSEKYGLPITITYYTDLINIKDINIRSVNLKETLNNKEIQIEVLTPETDIYLKNTIIILPLSEYKSNTKYKLDINFNIYSSNNVKISKSYNGSFITKTNKISESMLTRSNFTKYLIELLQIKLEQPDGNFFSDIDINDITAKHIYTAYKNNLISGYPNNTFGPNKGITIEQAYVILIRAYEKKHGEIDIQNSNTMINIRDVNDISNWAYQYILKAYKIGLVNNSNEEHNLQPLKNLTESEYKRIINNFKKYY